MSGTMALHVHYNSVFVYFFAVLCKNTTWHDQILRWLKSVDYDSQCFKILFKFIAVPLIQFRDHSVDSDKQS